VTTSIPELDGLILVWVIGLTGTLCSLSFEIPDFPVVKMGGDGWM
jgi:hypothetical protein